MDRPEDVDQKDDQGGEHGRREQRVQPGLPAVRRHAVLRRSAGAEPGGKKSVWQELSLTFDRINIVLLHGASNEQPGGTIPISTLRGRRVRYLALGGQSAFQTGALDLEGNLCDCGFLDLAADEERGILFSTHITSDLERCADYITYLQNGRVLASTDRETFLETYCLVSGGPDRLTPELEAQLIGCRKQAFGFEAMMLSQDAAALRGLQTAKATLEEIMVHLEREARE